MNALYKIPGGELRPALVTRDHGDGNYTLTVFLDPTHDVTSQADMTALDAIGCCLMGPGVFCAPSARQGTGPGEWQAAP